MAEESLLKIEEIKKAFLDLCRPVKVREAENIWARWIIEQRSLSIKNGLFFSKDLKYSVQLIQELVDKNCSQERAKNIQSWLIKEITLLENKSPCLISDDSCTNIYSLKLPKKKFPPIIKRKLVTMCHGNVHIAELTWALYSLLSGKGLQWALPRQLLDYFRKEYNCNTEIFASPINSHYKNYYSLFDTDIHLGSKGDFFKAPDSVFTKGSFQINPPFIISVFDRTTKRILSLLRKAVKKKYSLLFIYVLPHWTSFKALHDLKDSQFYRGTVNLEKGEHAYMDYSTNRKIEATFGTSVIFLSTEYRIPINKAVIQTLFS